MFLATLPATLVPALVSIASIAVFTRLLPPDAFGRYTLIFSAVMVGQTVLFNAPALATIRFHAASAAERRSASFLASVYALFASIAACTGAGLAAASLLLPHAFGQALWLGAPLLLCRAAVGQNQAANRAAGRIGRYTLVECCHAMLGFGAGLVLVLAGIDGTSALLASLIAAAASAAAIDLRRVLAACRSHPDRAVLNQITAFAWPLALAYAVASCLTYADRMLVGSFAGAAALGIYGTAFSLVERPITLICVSVTSGTFPLAVEAYARDGPEAGRRQAGRNGAMLIGLALPACLGLALTAPAIAAVVVGPAFRDGVAALIPVMALTAFLRGLCAHYIDHAFHLAKASRTMLAVYAPWAVASVLCSAVLVSHYGMQAAAYGALACQTGAALTGWAISSRVLRLWLPLAELTKIAICSGIMAAVLLLTWDLPDDAPALVLRIAAGVLAYGASAWWVDLAGLRSVAGRQYAPLPVTRLRRVSAMIRRSRRQDQVSM